MNMININKNINNTVQVQPCNIHAYPLNNCSCMHVLHILAYVYTMTHWLNRDWFNVWYAGLIVI